MATSAKEAEAVARTGADVPASDEAEEKVTYVLLTAMRINGRLHSADDKVKLRRVEGDHYVSAGFARETHAGE